MTNASSSPLPESLIEQPELVFQAPWEARAFALVNYLAASEHYDWSEWTNYLSREIAAAEPNSADATSYYEQWVNACEKLLTVKGLLEPESLQRKIAELASEHEAKHQH